MTLTHTYNGAPLGFDIPPTKVSIPQRAELGAVSMGGVSPEDPAAALNLVGWRPYIIEETACSQPRLFTGWVADRGIGRSAEQAQIVGLARVHDTTIIDLNALFSFRIISGSDGNRPEETPDERLAWIMGSAYLTGLIADTGYVKVIGMGNMDAADYRDGYADAVISDCADFAFAPINWFAFWDPVALAVGLFFDDIDAAVYDSTLRISNDLADIDAVTFAPTSEARLEREPDQTWAEVVVEYRGGARLFRSRASTATTHIRRGTKISHPRIGRLTTAQAWAESFLDLHAGEIDQVTATIRVPRASVGLVTAGQRMNIKLTHAGAPYTAWTSMRVIACQPTAVDDHAQHYDVALELVSPRPASVSTAILQSKVAYGSFPITVTLDAAPTAGRVLLAVVAQSYNSELGPPTLGATPGSWTVEKELTTGPYLGVAILSHAVLAADPAAWAFSSTTGYEGRVCLMEVSGLTVPADATGSADGSGAAMSASVTPTAGQAIFLLGGAVYYDQSPATPAGDITEVDDGTTGGATGYGWTGYRTIASASGAYAVAATLVGSSNWGEVVAAFTSGGSDTEIILPPAVGTTILAETPTPAPDGTTVLFTLANGYLSGSLLVYVDGIPIPSSKVTETNPAAGTFTLSWAPDADEHITVLYVTG